MKLVLIIILIVVIFNWRQVAFDFFQILMNVLQGHTSVLYTTCVITPRDLITAQVSTFFMLAKTF